MADETRHQDAIRLERIEAGLPPDVYDETLVAAYAEQQPAAAKKKAASPKPTKKGG